MTFNECVTANSRVAKLAKSFGRSRNAESPGAPRYVGHCSADLIRPHTQPQLIHRNRNDNTSEFPLPRRVDG